MQRLFHFKLNHKICLPRLDSLQGKFAAMVVQNFLYEGKANALSVFFCTKKGAEELGAELFGNSFSGIRNR